MNYKWLHISDLHSLCKGIKTQIMRADLISEIKYMSMCSPFAFVLITGDISDKNQGYEEAKKLILEIIDVAGVTLNKVFIVPGNHDVDRNIPEKREGKAKKYWKIDLLDKKENDAINELREGQKVFFNVYKDILGRDYPMDKLHFFDKIDENLSIIQLNTSWMCSNSNKESGKLHIGLQNLYDCLNQEELKNSEIKIAIGHHRVNDFNKTVEGHIKSLFKTQDIDLYFGGHCHESSVIFDPQINTEFCSCRQVRAEDEYYPAGFVVGNINTIDDQSSFEFYNWSVSLAKWTYDYTVTEAKHGKYYLKNEKFNKTSIQNRDIFVDFKLFNDILDRTEIMEKFNLVNSAIYSPSLRDVRPKNIDEWNNCLVDIRNLYESIVKNSGKKIHIFPLALIPLLVSFGYLVQNNSSNILIYQYIEDNHEWVLDEKDDNIEVSLAFKENKSKILALAVSVSGKVFESDINEVLKNGYDLLEVTIDSPMTSKLNYKADVLRVKKAIRKKLSEIYSNYQEIHLFLAAPAGLCIEIGRIIRENMYPDTYIYNFNRSNSIKYEKVANLKDIYTL